MPERTDPKIVRVIAAVIISGNYVLICKRPLHKRHGGLWEFPGGKIHNGESHFDASNRELDEELKVKVVSVGAHVYTAQDPNSQFSIEFVETKIEGEPMAVEHSEVRWCYVQELKNFKFAPADTAFINDHLMR